MHKSLQSYKRSCCRGYEVVDGFLSRREVLFWDLKCVEFSKYPSDSMLDTVKISQVGRRSARTDMGLVLL